MQKTKISPQLKYYRKNKKTIDKKHYTYQKRNLVAGRFALENNLIDEEAMVELGIKIK